MGNDFQKEVFTQRKWLLTVTVTLAFLTLLIFIARFALPLRDGDIWWHMLYGEYHLTNRTLIPDHTLYSWAPVHDNTIYCTWLPDIFLFLLYQAQGVTGLLVFRTLCMALFVFSAIRFAHHCKALSNPLTWFAIQLSILISLGAAYSKPEIFTYVLFSLTVWNYYHIRLFKEKSVINCYLFPLIILIWINSHGGIIFGIVFLVLVAIGEILNWVFKFNALPKRLRLHLFSSLILSAVALFCNPYGYHYLWELIAGVIPSQENLAYINTNSAFLNPFESTAANGHLAEYANLIFLTLIIAIACTKKKRLDFSLLLTNIVFAFLYTKYLRTTFYWAPVFCFSCLFLLSEPKKCFNRKAFLYTVASVVTVCSLFLTSRTLFEAKCKPAYRTWLGYGVSEFHPVDATQYIAMNYSEYKIANTFNQGAYLLWHLRPKEGVLLDSRAFPFRGQVLTELLQAENGINTGKIVSKYPADLWCINIENQRMTQWFHSSPEWNLAFYGINSAVFVRKNLSHTPEIEVSENILKFKSLNSGLYIISFALTINDWQTVNGVIKALEDRFSCPDARILASNASSMIKGVQAYTSGNYGLSTRILQNITPDSPINGAPLLAYSLLHVADTAWKQNDIDAAWRLAYRAWQVHPENPYTVFNAGIIAWYATEIETPSPNQGGELAYTEESAAARKKWKKFLETFVRNQQELPPSLKEHIIVANKILQNQYDTKPLLVIPQ